MKTQKQILLEELEEIGCGSYAPELLDYDPEEVIKAVIKGFGKWLQQKQTKTLTYHYDTITKLLEELEAS